MKSALLHKPGTCLLLNNFALSSNFFLRMPPGITRKATEIGKSLAGLLGGAILLPLVIRFFRVRETRDQTAAFHHTHSKPVSRLGGISLAGAFIFSSFVAACFHWDLPSFHQKFWGIVGGALAMFSLGLFDDLKPLGAKNKLFCQILISLGVYSSGIRVEHLNNLFTGEAVTLGIWSIPLTVFWLVALTNLINLIDGIDGLAGGVSLMLMILLAVVSFVEEPLISLLAAGMAGGLIAFLKYNFPPAKIYMGDGGAYLLGFLIGVLSVGSSQKSTALAALVAPLFALGLPIIDVTMAMLRRGVKGLPLFRPDKKHIHHRLVDKGLSRRGAVLALYGLSLIFLGLGFVVFWLQGRYLPIFLGIMCLLFIITARWANIYDHPMAIWGVLDRALKMRKDVKYALSLSRWLELEAQRANTLDDLWKDFIFLGSKLGFTWIKLDFGTEHLHWASDNQPAEKDRSHKTHHRLGFHKVRLEFEACSSKMSPKMFEMLTELSTEAWLNASTTWCKTRKVDLHLQPGSFKDAKISSSGLLVPNPSDV